MRRAAIVLFILGGLMSVCGLCVSGVASTVPAEQLAAQTPIPLPPEVSPKMLLSVMIGVWLVVAVFGIAKVVLGIFVYNGRRPAIVVAIVVSSILVLLAVLSFLNDVRLALSSGNPMIAGGALLAAVLAGVLILELVWLIQAAKAATAVKAAWANYHAEQWKNAQTSNGGAAGYWGYGLPQPPPGQGPIANAMPQFHVPPPPRGG
jgi:hypothetical protein